MSYYCQLWDTAIPATERPVAVTTMKLRAFRRAPLVLGTVHAISSSAILDDCCDDPHFLKLVECGRIQFLAGPDGTGPGCPKGEEPLDKGVIPARRALIYGFMNREYRLDNWPGIWPPAEDDSKAAQRDAGDARRKAIDFLLGGREVGIPALDARLQRAHKLFEAIRVASDRRKGPELEEAPRSAYFKELIQGAPGSVDPGLPELRGMMERLARLETSSRSVLYTAIENDPIAVRQIPNYHEELSYEQAAKEGVDALYGRSVAKSLGQTLLSVRPRFFGEALLQAGKQESLELQIRAENAARKAPELTWKDVFKGTEALQREDPSVNDAADARNELMDLLIGRRPDGKASQKAAEIASSVAGNLVLTMAGQGLVSFLAGAVAGATAGGVLGVALALGPKWSRRSRARRAISCWVDPTPPPAPGTPSR